MLAYVKAVIYVIKLSSFFIVSLVSFRLTFGVREKNVIYSTINFRWFTSSVIRFLKNS